MSSADRTVETEEVPWSTLDACLVIIGAFCIYLLGSIIMGIIDYGIEGKHEGFWVIPSSYVFFTLGTVLMVMLWLVGHRRSSWSTVGFKMDRLGVSVTVALGGLLAVFVGEAVIVSLVNTFTAFHVKGNAQELLPAGQHRLLLAQYVTLAVLAAVVAPVTEETLFRGVLYQALRRDCTRLVGRVAHGRAQTWAAVAVAALLSGAVFGAFHLIGGAGEIYSLPILVYLGVVLAVVFQSAGSLSASMLVHACINFVSVTYLFTHGS